MGDETNRPTDPHLKVSGTLKHSTFIPESLTMQSSANCTPSQPVPLLRAYHPTAMDHFYTTDANEMANAVKKLGYNQEGIATHVFTTQALNTIPLYRMFNGAVIDHFYTTSYLEVQSAAANSGYTYEGIAAYVYGFGACQGVPFYRLYSSRATDHFYTTSTSEVNSAIIVGYKMEGIVAYVCK